MIGRIMNTLTHSAWTVLEELAVTKSRNQEKRYRGYERTQPDNKTKATTFRVT